MCWFHCKIRFCGRPWSSKLSLCWVHSLTIILILQVGRLIIYNKQATRTKLTLEHRWQIANGTKTVKETLALKVPLSHCKRGNTQAKAYIRTHSVNTVAMIVSYASMTVCRDAERSRWKIIIYNQKKISPWYILLRGLHSANPRFLCRYFRELSCVFVDLRKIFAYSTFSREKSRFRFGLIRIVCYGRGQVGAFACRVQQEWRQPATFAY